MRVGHSREKIAKAIIVVLEANPRHVLLLPDIINAFNTIRRKLSVERLMEEVPEMTPAIRYSYQVYAALIESVDQSDNQESMGKSETGFTQGDSAASAGFSLNHAKCLMEPLRKFAKEIEANLTPEEQTFLAALCDDTMLAGPPATVVTLYLKLRKMAKDIYNLEFHQGPKCKAYSPARTARELQKVLADEQDKAILADSSLAPYAIQFNCANNDDGITIIDKSNGTRSLGVPIGSDAFKLNYIQQVWDKTKNDWAKILENVFNKKWRLDMLKFGLHARFNHLFRCIEPRITS